MLQISKKIIVPLIFTIVFIGGATVASAQNMSNTVVEKQVNFARGQSKASLRGSAKYGMSYVYKLTAKKGQTMEIGLTGNSSELTFSLIAPDEETMEDGFGVTEWSGELPQSGEYKIVVVMNDEDAAAVAYQLDLEIY